MPILWSCRKQDGTAQHTQDAGMVSVAKWSRDDAIALQELFPLILGMPIVIRIMEDNAAMITCCPKGLFSHLATSETHPAYLIWNNSRSDQPEAKRRRRTIFS